MGNCGKRLKIWCDQKEHTRCKEKPSRNWEFSREFIRNNWTDAVDYDDNEGIRPQKSLYKELHWISSDSVQYLGLFKSNHGGCEKSWTP